LGGETIRRPCMPRGFKLYVAIPQHWQGAEISVAGLIPVGQGTQVLIPRTSVHNARTFGRVPRPGTQQNLWSTAGDRDTATLRWRESQHKAVSEEMFITSYVPVPLPLSSWSFCPTRAATNPCATNHAKCVIVFSILCSDFGVVL
jgi:hypothetical protein